jgi:hypothetical protein
MLKYNDPYFDDSMPMTSEQQKPNKLTSTFKDRNLDGQYLVIMREEQPEPIVQASIPYIIEESIKFDPMGANSPLAGFLFGQNVALASHTLCTHSAYKLGLWTLTNSIKDTKFPKRTKVLEMEEEGDKQALLRRTLRGISDLNEVVTFSAATHYLKLCKSRMEKIDYLLKLNSEFFDLGGQSLSETSIFIKYLCENRHADVDKLIPAIAKRYAFINPIGDIPQLDEIRHNLEPTIKKIINSTNHDRILSREEIHGASDGFIMLSYDEVNELVVELHGRSMHVTEFFNILWLAALKRALLFDHNNRDFKANKSMGWLLSISGITYLHAIKNITSSLASLGVGIYKESLCNWLIYAIWLILDTSKTSLTGDRLASRLDAISPLSIRNDDAFYYEKMVEYATHLYPDESLREAFGFAYRHPESQLEIVCQMINYLFEYDNGEAMIESSFLRLSSALLNMVQSNFATMLGSYSSALIALSLSNRMIFNFGRGNSRYELISQMYGSI